MNIVNLIQEKTNKNILRIFLIVIFLINCSSIYGQNQRVRLTGHDVTLKEIFAQIEEQTKMFIDYKASEIDVSKIVKNVPKENDLNSVLEDLFQGVYISKYENNHIIIKKNNSSKNINNKVIKGAVTDENGEAIIGANIIEKGTSNGTITDVDGKFSLLLTNPKSQLLISFIGFVEKTVQIGDLSVISIKLKEETLNLDEVVVIGYGTQKKINLTGAVAVVKGDEMIKRPVTNASSMLQAQIPGLQVVNGSGQSGNNKVSLRIRGQGTYSSAGSDPLILINGVPGDLSNVDPNAIESISVLKDAASSAIYGARAANGVILVTTKSGLNQETKIMYSANFAVYSPTRMLDVVTNSVEYMNLWNEAKANSGISDGLYSQNIIDAYKNASPGDWEYPNYDWLGKHIHSAFSHNHNLNVTGGSEKTSYNISMYYADEGGTMDGHNFKKYNFTADLQTKITKWMTFGTYVGCMRSDRKRPYEGGTDGSFTSIFAQAPTYSPRLPNGDWTYKAYPWEYNNKNVIALIGNNAFRKNIAYDVNAQVWLTVDIFKGLSWHTKGAVRFNSENEKEWRPLVKLYNYHSDEYMSDLDVGAKGLNSNIYQTFYTYLYSYLKYDLSIQEKKHNINLQLGYSQETNNYQWLKGYRKDFAFPLTELDAGSTSLQEVGGNQEQWSLMGLFGRLNYNFKERYLFEANFRYDGSSRINPDDRWGLFPSFSGAWRITEEKIIQKLHLDWLNSLKLRASWGQLGNQNIGIYPYQAVIVNEGDYSYNNSSLSPGYAQTKYANKDITWETTTATNLGIDATLFDGLSFTIEWYRKKTTDILRNAQVTGVLGLTAPVVNKGEMINNGIELSAAYTNKIKRTFLKGAIYNIGFIFNRNKNKLTKFGAEEISGQYLYKEGLPYGSYYILENIGIFKDEADIRNSPKQFNDNTLPGDLKYRDANGDGIINNDDRVVISGRFPKYDYSVSGSINWKGIDLSVLVQGVEGVRHYVTDWGLQPFRQGSAPTKDYVKHRWTPENTENAKYPRMYYDNFGGSKNTRKNSYFLKNASYMRLKNVTVGYTIPSILSKKILIDKARIFFSGDNLLTITKYPELDPERDGDGRFVAYPQNKICSFGVNVQF